MSKLETNTIDTVSGSNTLTLGSTNTSTISVGSPISNGLTLSDNILFDTASKGIYLGVTSATSSNLLDDYEEGTWTPNVGGNATYTVQTGDYIKIGKLVYVTGIIQINNLGTGSNTTIVGLPFSGDNSNPFNGSVGYFNSLASSVVNITPYNQLGNTNINFRTLTSASNSSGTSNTIFQNGTRVDFSLTYLTA